MHAASARAVDGLFWRAHLVFRAGDEKAEGNSSHSTKKYFVFNANNLLIAKLQILQIS
jgi:hypothetical protein